MSKLDSYIYPKLTEWRFRPEKLCYATVPAHTKKIAANLLQFLDDNNEFSTNFSSVELVESIFPSDCIVFFDKNNQVVLLLNILELEQLCKDLM